MLLANHYISTFSEMDGRCVRSKQEGDRIWGDCSPNVMLWRVTVMPEFQESYRYCRETNRKDQTLPWSIHMKNSTPPLTYARLGIWHPGWSQSEDHLAQCHKSSCLLEWWPGIVPPGTGVQHIGAHPIRDPVPPGTPATAVAAVPHSHSLLGCLYKGATLQSCLALIVSIQKMKGVL
jgi:hypothetical protein